MTVKLIPNEAMKNCLAELIQGRKILHIIVEPSQMDILKYNGQKAKNLQRPKIAVLCVTTGISYDSIAEASKATAVASGAISRCVNNKQKTANGLVFIKSKEIQ